MLPALSSQKQNRHYTLQPIVQQEQASPLFVLNIMAFFAQTTWRVAPELAACYNRRLSVLWQTR
jgi:hypothetical protein